MLVILSIRLVDSHTWEYDSCAVIYIGGVVYIYIFIY